MGYRNNHFVFGKAWNFRSKSKPNTLYRREGKIMNYCPRSFVKRPSGAPEAVASNTLHFISQSVVISPGPQECCYEWPLADFQCRTTNHVQNIWISFLSFFFSRPLIIVIRGFRRRWALSLNRYRGTLQRNPCSICQWLRSGRREKGNVDKTLDLWRGSHCNGLKDIKL